MIIYLFISLYLYLVNIINLLMYLFIHIVLINHIIMIVNMIVNMINLVISLIHPFLIYFFNLFQELIVCHLLKSIYSIKFDFQEISMMRLNLIIKYLFFDLIQTKSLKFYFMIMKIFNCFNKLVNFILTIKLIITINFIITIKLIIMLYYFIYHFS